MTIQSIGGEIIIPALAITSTALNSRLTMDAEIEKVQFIIKIPKTGKITQVGVVTDTVVQATNGVDIRLETVSTTTGDATGTLIDPSATGTEGTLATDTRYWVDINSGTGVDVTAGDFIAVVIVWNSWVAGNDVDWSVGLKDRSGFSTFPYYGLYTGSWSKISERCNVGVQIDSSIVYLQGTCLILPNTVSVSIGTGATYDARGVKFSLPFPAKLSGISSVIDADGDWKIIVYDSDGTTPLFTSSVHDKDIRADVSPNTFNTQLPIGSEISLAKDTDYRVVVVAETATTLATYAYELAAAGDRETLPNGISISGTKRAVAGGAWTDATTEYPLMNLHFNAFDDGVGGAGVSAKAARNINNNHMVM